MGSCPGETKGGSGILKKKNGESSYCQRTKPLPALREVEDLNKGSEKAG